MIRKGVVAIVIVLFLLIFSLSAFADVGDQNTLWITPNEQIMQVGGQVTFTVSANSDVEEDVFTFRLQYDPDVLETSQDQIESLFDEGDGFRNSPSIRVQEPGIIRFTFAEFGAEEPTPEYPNLPAEPFDIFSVTFTATNFGWSDLNFIGPDFDSVVNFENAAVNVIEGAPECQEDNDCVDPDHICVDNECVAQADDGPECQADDDCLNPALFCVGNECVQRDEFECGEDADCDLREVCEAGFCVPVGDGLDVTCDPGEALINPSERDGGPACQRVVVRDPNDDDSNIALQIQGILSEDQDDLIKLSRIATRLSCDAGNEEHCVGADLGFGAGFLPPHDGDICQPNHVQIDGECVPAEIDPIIVRIYDALQNNQYVAIATNISRGVFE